MADNEQTPATEPEAQSSETPTNDSESASQEPEVSGASSLEEVEAYWRKRMSNSDKAHAAERRVLQEKLESVASQSSGATGADSEVQPQVLKELTQRLEQAEARATAAELKAKYPTAVEAIGDAARYMDESRLASLNESLNFDASRPTRVDQNNPARSATSPQSPEDMSLEELTAYVKTLDFPK